MDEQAAKQILDTVVGHVFGYQNPLSLEQAMNKFAFDVRLPQQVYDHQTNEPTWAAALGDTRYLTPASVKKKTELDGNVQPAIPLNSLEDIMAAWGKVNFAMAERQIGSKRVGESDGVYHSENVYRSIDVRKSSNILFSDGVDGCDHVVAGQTSKACTQSIRVEDSKNVKNSFNVVWSNQIKNSFFVQDCYDLQDCMFCTHLAGKQYCVANIQLSKEQYEKLKLEVTRWILTT